MNTTNNNTIRVQSTFLVHPKYEGRSYPCYESGFNATRQDSIRVKKMDDMRLGLIDATPEEFADYLSKQPIFYFQERFADDENTGFEWNGYLLFSIHGKNEARKTALAHKDELHIILSFDDPDYDRYYILVDTGTGGGTKEEFLKWQEDVRDMCLKPFFHKPVGFNYEHYIRAVNPDHYDIVDWDTLFGKPVSVADLQTRSTTHLMSLIAIIFNRIRHFFKKTA